MVSKGKLHYFTLGLKPSNKLLFPIYSPYLNSALTPPASPTAEAWHGLFLESSHLISTLLTFPFGFKHYLLNKDHPTYSKQIVVSSHLLYLILCPFFFLIAFIPSVLLCNSLIVMRFTIHFLPCPCQNVSPLGSEICIYLITDISQHSRTDSQT